MRLITTLLVLFGLSVGLRAETSFPSLSLYSLQGETKTLPNGKRGLIFIGWRREACDALTQWYSALQAKPKLARRLSITVVPVFPSCMSYAVCRMPLMALLRRSLPERLSGHVGVLFSSVEETASLFRQSKDDFADLRVFLIDERGAIVWQAAGGPTVQALRQLELVAGI